MTWANQVRILKQNFQQLASVLGGTLINALKPLVKALNVVISKIIAFAKVISDALGTIFGWTYEEGSGGGVADDFGDAASSADDLAGSTGKAAKNIKEMKAGLRAFDELKTINMPDNSDTSGGGSGGGTSGGAGGATADGGQWKKTETKFFDSDIDTLYKLGKAISEALIDAMESIDWDSIYEKARNFGKGLADFLNGLFAGHNGKTLFGELGRTIASALNTAVYAALEFAKEFDFKQFGYNIADGINNFFKTFDFTALAQTLNLWAKGILTALNEAITKTDWKMVGNKIGEFLRELDFVDIATDIADTLWEAIKAAISLWSGMFEEAPVETVLLTAFGVMKFTKVGKLIAGKISKQIVAWLGTALGVEVAADATIGSVIATGIVSKIGASIASMGGILGMLKVPIGEIIGAGTAAEIGTFIGTSIFGSIAAAIAGWNIGQLINEAITGEEIDMSFFEQMDEIKNSFSDGSWKDALSLWKDDIETNLIALADDEQKLFEKIIGKFNDFKDLFDDGQFSSAMKLWRDDIAENLAQMTVDFQTKFDEIKTNVLNKATEIKESASSKWQSMKEDIKGANALIKQDMSDTLTNIASKISGWYTNDVAPWFTIEKWQSFGKNIKESLSNKWNEFTNWWSNTGFANWWNNQVTPWFKADKWKFDGIKSGLTSAWNGAIDGIKQIWNNFANWLNSKLTFTIDPIVVAGKTVFEGTTINLGKIPTFYTGGFPEDGWFRASHGEMLGRFDNGQSVVANNMQITEGISDAVYRGNQQMVSYMQQEITELRKQNEYLMQIAAKEFGISEKQIGQSARKYAREYSMRTGREAYSF